MLSLSSLTNITDISKSYQSLAAYLNNSSSLSSSPKFYSGKDPSYSSEGNRVNMVKKERHIINNINMNNNNTLSNQNFLTQQKIWR